MNELNILQHENTSLDNLYKLSERLLELKAKEQAIIDMEEQYYEDQADNHINIIKDELNIG